MKSWLAEYLQQSFEYAECCSTDHWSATQYWSAETVGEVLHLTELDRGGYGVMEDAEARLQIRWRREGNWKAGSTPF